MPKIYKNHRVRDLMVYCMLGFIRAHSFHSREFAAYLFFLRASVSLWLSLAVALRPLRPLRLIVFGIGFALALANC